MILRVHYRLYTAVRQRHNLYNRNKHYILLMFGDLLIINNPKRLPLYSRRSKEILFINLSKHLFCSKILNITSHMYIDYKSYIWYTSKYY